MAFDSDLQTILADLLTANRRLVAAVRCALGPPPQTQTGAPRDDRLTARDHLDEAIRVIEGVEKRLEPSNEGEGRPYIPSTDRTNVTLNITKVRDGTMMPGDAL